jgi:hypothetical protein
MWGFAAVRQLELFPRTVQGVAVNNIYGYCTLITVPIK